MKKETTAYITALIDNHDMEINRSLSQTFKDCHEVASKELLAILDYIDGFEKKKTNKSKDWEKIFGDLKHQIGDLQDIVQYENHKNYELSKEIKELEASCRNFAEVEKNLHNKIEKLENELLALKIMKNEKSV